MSEYRIPATVRWFPWIWLAAILAMPVLLYGGHNWQWMPSGKAFDPSADGTLVGLALAFVLFVWWMSTWPKADHFVTRVEWSTQGIRLQPRVGSPLEVRWDLVSGAEVPQHPGYRGPYAAMYYHAKIRVSDDPRPFLIPLDWSAQCAEFLRALEQHGDSVRR